MVMLLKAQTLLMLVMSQPSVLDILYEDLVTMCYFSNKIYVFSV